MKRLKLLTGIVLLFLNYSVYPQYTYSKDIKELQKNARTDYDSGDFFHAVKHFSFLVKYAPNDLELRYFLGMSHMRVEQLEEAIPHLRKAQLGGYQPKARWSLVWDEANQDYLSEQIEWNLAKAYHKTDKFDEALKHYRSFHEDFSIHSGQFSQSDDQIIRHNINQVQNARLYKNHKEQVANVAMLPKQVNTVADEIYPLPIGSDDELLFSRESGVDFRQIFSTSTRSEVLGQEAMNQSSFKGVRSLYWVSPTGKSIIAGDVNAGDLNYFNNINGTWEKGSRFTLMDFKKYDVLGFTSSSDGNVFVVSARSKSSSADYDLFRIRRNRIGRWSEPERLPDPINTLFDEVSPFIDVTTNTLYFSSEGHTSMGGWDIFEADYDAETDNWITVKNMGVPMNSSGDDLFFIKRTGTNQAYFCSHRSRNTEGGLDLFQAEMPDHKPTHRRVVIDGNVLDESSGVGVNALISISTNRQGGAGKYTYSLSQSGEFYIDLEPGRDYTMRIESPYYQELTKEFHVNGSAESGKVHLDLYLKPILTGDKMVLDDIHFENNQAVLPEISYYELDKVAELLLDSTHLSIEIAGHTEIGGIETYNQELSQARAEAVAEYLHALGIPRKQIMPIGYGSKYPLTKKHDEKSEELNRRTELIIRRPE